MPTAGIALTVSMVVLLAASIVLGLSIRRASRGIKPKLYGRTAWICAVFCVIAFAAVCWALYVLVGPISETRSAAENSAIYLAPFALLGVGVAAGALFGE